MGRGDTSTRWPWAHSLCLARCSRRTPGATFDVGSSCLVESKTNTVIPSHLLVWWSKIAKGHGSSAHCQVPTVPVPTSHDSQLEGCCREAIARTRTWAPAKSVAPPSFDSAFHRRINGEDERDRFPIEVPRHTHGDEVCYGMRETIHLETWCDHSYQQDDHNKQQQQQQLQHL